MFISGNPSLIYVKENEFLYVSEGKRHINRMEY